MSSLANKGKSWESLVGNWPSDDEKEAMDFMRRLTCLCVCQIAGCRKAVPPGSLRKVAVRDCDFRVFMPLPPAKKNFVSDRIVSKLRGIMPSLYGRFLKELTVVISNNDTDESDALEVYTFSFGYIGGPSVTILNNEGQPVSTELRYRGPSYVKEDTFNLMSTIWKLSKILEPLPEGSFFSFRSLFNENVPENYMPQGWYDVQPNEPLYEFNHPDAAANFSIGNVQTKHIGSFVAVRSWCLTDAFDVEQQLLNGDLELSAAVQNPLERTIDDADSDNSFDGLNNAVQKMRLANSGPPISGGVEVEERQPVSPQVTRTRGNAEASRKTASASSDENKGVKRQKPHRDAPSVRTGDRVKSRRSDKNTPESSSVPSPMRTR